MRIVYWTAEECPATRPSSNRDVIEAAKNMVMMDLALPASRDRGWHVQEADRGACQGGSLRATASEVCVAAIAAWWRRGGLLRRAAIEQMVPESSIALGNAS